MKTALAFIAAAAFALSLASTADAQKIDKNGRCHDAAGRFAKAAVCGGVSKTPPKTVVVKEAPAKTDTKAGTVKEAPAKAEAKSAPAAAEATAAAPKAAKAKAARCKNEKGKFVKCTAAGAKPV